MDKVTIELRKHHFLRIVPDEYSMDFELVERIISNGKDDEQVLIEGFLKWDGCMNWKTTRYYHFCEDDDADLVRETFEKLWEIGPEHISYWLE